MFGVISLSFVLIIYFIVMLIASLYVYKDAGKRNMSPAGWALITFFVPFLIGLIIYLICRNPLVDFQCPSCGAGLLPNASKCSKCGHSMLTQCPECEFPVQKGWKTCPKCGSVLPEKYEQPVRTYRKDNSGFVIIGVLVGILVLVFVLVVVPAGLFNRVEEHYSEGYGGVQGMYNITKEDMSANAEIASWIEKSDKSKKDIHVLLSKESGTCLVYVKNSEYLMSGTMDLSYYDDKECNAVLMVSDYEYEDKYGYDFFLFEFEVYEDTTIEVFMNDGSSDAVITTTDKDISMNTWGGSENER